MPPGRTVSTAASMGTLQSAARRAILCISPSMATSQGGRNQCKPREMYYQIPMALDLTGQSILAVEDEVLVRLKSLGAFRMQERS